MYSTIRVGNKPTWPEYIGEERYERQVYRLQNEAGLSFKEARAALTPYQVFPSLAKEWGVTTQAVYNYARRGRCKVEKVTGIDWDRSEDLLPSDMYLVI